MRHQFRVTGIAGPVVQLRLETPGVHGIELAFQSAEQRLVGVDLVDNNGSLQIQLTIARKTCLVVELRLEGDERAPVLVDLA